MERGPILTILQEMKGTEKELDMILPNLYVNEKELEKASDEFIPPIKRLKQRTIFL